jgi:iron(III) transport system substrate-binding protein
MQRSFLFALVLLAAAQSFAAPAHAQEKITVYTAGPANLIDRLAAGFKKETGIDVGVFQGTTGQVMARVESEASNPVADVLISASWDTAEDFTKRGLLLPYTSPNAATVPASLKTETAVAQGISALGIVWNPKSNTPRPAEWADLAKPAFQGLVTMPDPAQSGASFELVAALAATNAKLFDDLKANGAIVAGANAQALNPVLQGAKAAVFGAVDYISLGQKAQGESVEVIFPASGTVAAARPIMIFKSSKHAAEAKKFIDYVLSDAGQAEVAKVYLMPARADIKADRPRLQDIKLLDQDTQKAYARRDEILATFRKTMGK